MLAKHSDVTELIIQAFYAVYNIWAMGLRKKFIEMQWWLNSWR
jgi:hypothetical protein